MTETSQVWTGTLIGDASVAPYSASEWAARQKLLQGQGANYPNYGVIKDSGGSTYEPLQVQAKSPASTNIEIEPGAALVAGYLYENTAALTLPVGANVSGNPRVDTVLLRVDFVAQTIRAAIKQGTPAVSPVHPALQQDATIWEIPIADIAVANGFSTIAQNNILQYQRYMNTMMHGWQPYAYPLVYDTGASYDGFSLTGSPSAPGDSVAIPFSLAGNMLLYQVQLWQRSTAAATWSVGWDVYKQDTNDGLVAENTARRVASSGTLTFSNTGAHGIYALGFTTRAMHLPPGAYWLVIQSRGGTPATIGCAHAVLTSPLPNACKAKNTTNPNGDTLDLVTGWTDTTDIPGVMLVGRVLGQ